MGKAIGGCILGWLMCGKMHGGREGRGWMDRDGWMMDGWRKGIEGGRERVREGRRQGGREGTGKMDGERGR